MTIYSINLGIGWASSGVEYAQAYRAKMLRGLHLPVKFVFMDMFQAENIQHLTSNIGFLDEEIIWLYGYFTDIKIAATTYSLAALEETFSLPIASVETNGSLRKYRFIGSELGVVVATTGEKQQYVQRVEYLLGGQLRRKDYFSYMRLFSEYYRMQDEKPLLFHRHFYNEDGSIAYEEEVRDGKSLYRFRDNVCYSKEELVAYFLEKLCLKETDLLLLDRATGIGQSIFQHKGKAKLAVVIHAEHFNRGATRQDAILWNNYYEYQFTNADKVDAFVVSTQRQKEVLAQQFLDYYGKTPRIQVLPVGSLEGLCYPEGARTPFSVMTASRLAIEKHIDWLILGVVRAKESLADLQFDIYGEGGQRQKLLQLIEEHQAQEYIHLKGHQSLADRYQGYEVYLTASTSEGFGLTLLEAIGSGLSMIGLDVPYGNQTFIQHQKNGYLIPFNQRDTRETMAQAFAECLLSYYQSSAKEKEEARCCSYSLAKEFLYTKLEDDWKAFVEEVCYDTII